MSKSLLLLSSSRVDDTEYLSHALPSILDFLDNNLINRTDKSNGDILFIPFAGVTVSFDEYEAMVQQPFTEIGYTITSIHHYDDPKIAISKASAIVVGGGNTFALLKRLYEHSLVEAIRQRVEDGVPYIGWSAGSNIAGPTIKTTNDMPIVEPPSFNALNLTTFQLNPHYIDGNPPGHNGETRQQRLEEFLALSADAQVIGIPEGTGLRFESGKLQYVGNKTAFIFSASGKTPFEDSVHLNQLIQK
jgi:dipeptidase E